MLSSESNLMTARKRGGMLLDGYSTQRGIPTKSINSNSTRKVQRFK